MCRPLDKKYGAIMMVEAPADAHLLIASAIVGSAISIWAPSTICLPELFLQQQAVNTGVLAEDLTCLSSFRPYRTGTSQQSLAACGLRSLFWTHGPQ